MRYNITFDNVTCNSKDKCRLHIASFQKSKRYKQELLTTSEIITKIEKQKYMYMPTELIYNKENKRFDFYSQTIYVLDIDNADNNIKSLKDLLSCFTIHKLYPFMIYETFSCTKKHLKYRVLFKTKTRVTNKSSRDQILLYLIDLVDKAYPNAVDKKCTDITRVFYPGKKTVFKDLEAFFDAREVFSRIYELINASSGENKILKTIRQNFPVVFEDYIKNISNTEKIENQIYDIYKGVSPNISPPVLLRRTHYTVRIIYKKEGDITRDTPQTHCKTHFLFNSKDSLKSTLKSIPLDKVLRTNTTIHCMIHNDQHPSMKLIYNEDQECSYYCYTCQRGYDIFSIIQHELQKHTNFPINYQTAFTWLVSQLHVSILDDKTYALMKNASQYLEVLNSGIGSSKEFENKYPKLHSRLDSSPKHLRILKFIVRQAINFAHTHPILNIEKPTLYVQYSSQEIADIMNNLTFNVFNFNTESVKYSLRFLTRIGLLIPMPEAEIPRKQYLYLEKWRQSKNYKRHINLYKIPIYTDELFQQAEDILINDYKTCAAVSGYSRDQLLCRDKNEIEANRKYPQDVCKRRVSKKTNDFYNWLCEMLKKRFEIKPYISIKEIKQKITEELLCSEAYCNRYFSKTMPGVMIELDLVRTTCTRGLKAVFHMNEDYANSTTIILPKRVYDVYPTMLQEYEEKIKQSIKNVAKQYLETQLNNSCEYVMWIDLRSYLEISFPDMKEKRITDIFYSGYDELVEEFKQQHHINILRTNCTREVMKRFQLTNPINSTYLIYIFEPIQESITQAC